MLGHVLFEPTSSPQSIQTHTQHGRLRKLGNVTSEDRTSETEYSMCRAMTPPRLNHPSFRTHKRSGGLGGRGEPRLVLPTPGQGTHAHAGIVGGNTQDKPDVLIHINGLTYITYHHLFADMPGPGPAHFERGPRQLFQCRGPGLCTYVNASETLFAQGPTNPTFTHMHTQTVLCQ